MFKLALPFFIVCETSLHAGSGSDIGIVDLPIQRERHTGFPKIESSGLKGGIREAFEENTDQIKVGTKNVSVNDDVSISFAFGPDEGDLHAGALGFTDARLLLFPVKSMKGVFAWITCPRVLERFRSDLKLCKKNLDFEMPEEKTSPRDCSLFIKGNNIVLEEYTFQITKDGDANGKCTSLARWLSDNLFPKPKGPKDGYPYWRSKMQKDIVVLSDDDFTDFVALSTEVVTRTKINSKTGTVQSGALFTEEYLPSETILYSLALASPIFTEEKDKKDSIFVQLSKNEEELVIEFFSKGIPEVIQLGGNATIGKGIVRRKVMEV